RRSILRGSVALAALPLLAACGASGAATSSAATTASAAAASTAAATTSSAVSVAAISAAPGFTLVDPKSVKINGTFNVIQAKDWSDIHNAFLQAQVKQYAQQQGWKLDISYADAFTGGSDFFQKMAGAVASGNGPDMLWGNYSTFQLNYLKTVQPVDDVVAAATKALGNYTAAWPLGNQIDGKWYTVPFFNRSGGWWARKSWFTAKNIDPLGIKDLQGWLDASVTVSDPTKRQWGWGSTLNRSGDGENNVTTAWFEAGNRLTDETGQKVLFNTQGSIDAFTWLKDVYTNPKYAKALPPGVDAWDDMGNNNAWYAGTIGFTSNAGTIFATALKNEPAIGNDTILVPQPAGATGAKQALNRIAGSGTSFYLMQGAKNVDATKAMIQYLLSKDIQTKIFATSQGYVTPGYDWGWDTDPVTKAPNNIDLIFKANVYSKDQFANYLPAPNPLLWVDSVGQAVVFTDTMAAILKGTAVKDAVAQGQTKIEAILKQFNGK
ncbi:MAG TPA: hypothetical protein VIU62_03745, partial [Chloroflexota bacterium]